MNEKIDIIIDEFNKVKIDIDTLQAEKFYEYYNMLIETNKVMNLTAITEFDDVIFKHFIDSVLIKNIETINDEMNFKNISLIDVGTGAGFPGIPLKIIYPDMNLTLLDSLNKRITFLENVVNKLDLKNVKCIHGRAEDYGSNVEYREKYDFCVSRAVANLSTLTEYCIPFVKVKGKFISYKSSNVNDEINEAKSAVKILSSNILDVKKMIIKDNKETEYERNFVIIEKIKTLKKQYPRKSGIPSRKPL